MMDKTTSEKQIKKINSATSCQYKAVSLYITRDFLSNSYIHAVYFYSV